MASRRDVLARAFMRGYKLNVVLGNKRNSEAATKRDRMALNTDRLHAITFKPYAVVECTLHNPAAKVLAAAMQVEIALERGLSTNEFYEAVNETHRKLVSSA